MKMTNEAIAGLEPEALWRYFAKIARYPRGSGNEEALARYVLDEAVRLGLSAKRDKVGNVVVNKPASPGRERVRSVCLQGHLDMVCEKNKDKQFDFEKDPIELVRKGNMLCANGTTLGGDNGIAVATQLAIMEDPSLQHGPLELLFTVEEETALTGAKNLEAGFIASRILMNLDSEEEGALYVGCSGGRDTWGTFAVPTEPVPPAHVGASLSVSGLKGGHSGLDLDKGRGNAVKILARVCLALSKTGCRVSSLRGGNKRNAIPREAEAALVIPESGWPEAEALVVAMEGASRAELSEVDPDLKLALLREPLQTTVFEREHQTAVLDAVSALPHGVIRMSAEMPELVETSTNVAAIDTHPGPGGTVVLVATSQRSSVASKLLEITAMVRTSLETAGAQVGQDSGYPGWTPNLRSEILTLTRETYRELFGRAPQVKAIHAGLECGIIGDRYPGIDMVSLGPTLEAVHSPDERIHIDTVRPFWDLLIATLARVS